MNVAFIIISVIIIIGFSESSENKWPPKELERMMEIISKKCIKKIGIPEENIQKFNRGEIHEDENLKCYMSCVFKEARLVDDEGHLNLEKITSKLDLFDEEVKMIVLRMGKRCLRPEGETPCETAFWYNTCWKKSDPEHYFLM